MQFITSRRITNIYDLKAYNTDGGSATPADTWNTRDLTVQTGDRSFASLSSNVINLKPGTYIVRGSVPANYTNQFKCRLRDTASGVTLAVGTSQQTSNLTSAEVCNRSFINGIFTITQPRTIELQMLVADARNTDGNGQATANSPVGGQEQELYSMIELEQL